MWDQEMLFFYMSTTTMLPTKAQCRTSDRNLCHENWNDGFAESESLTIF